MVSILNLVQDDKLADVSMSGEMLIPVAYWSKSGWKGVFELITY